MPARTSTLIPMPKLAPFGLVFACSAILTLATSAFGFRSPWNFAWYFGLPTLVEVVCNAGFHDRIRMAVWLSAFSFLTVMVVGVVFGLGD